MAPVFRLDEDVLAKIFQLCLPDGLISHRSWDAPLLVTQVCRSWRRMAVSMPVLWSFISISLNDDSHLPLDLLRIWLARSGTHPLTVSITESTATDRADSNPTGHTITQEWHNARLRVLVNQARRWNSLSINALSLADKIVDLLPPGGTPLLEKIFVTVDYEPVREPHGINHLFRSPRLSVVEFYDGQERAILDKVVWHRPDQLSKVLIDSPSHFWCRLRLFSGLTHLTFCDRLMTDFHFVGPEIHIPNLLSLHLLLFQETSHMLDHFNLPSLKNLRLDYKGGGLKPPVHPFLVRTHCPLESLDCVGVSFDEEDVLLCLSLIRNSLRILSIESIASPEYSATPEHVTGGKLADFLIKGECPNLEFLFLGTSFELLEEVEKVIRARPNIETQWDGLGLDIGGSEDDELKLADEFLNSLDISNNKLLAS